MLISADLGKSACLGVHVTSLSMFWRVKRLDLSLLVPIDRVYLPTYLHSTDRAPPACLPAHRSLALSLSLRGRRGRVKTPFYGPTRVKVAYTIKKRAHSFRCQMPPSGAIHLGFLLSPSAHASAHSLERDLEKKSFLTRHRRVDRRAIGRRSAKKIRLESGFGTRRPARTCSHTFF